VASLAKRFEQVYLPGRSEPVEVPRGSEALFMLQRIRDESHRFAIAYHRQLRGKRMTLSELDEVPGLGPRRRERLIEHFGSVPKVRAAELDSLLELSWLPDPVAEAVHERLHGEVS
jgi:excinuclease ABC subunit C